MALGGRPSIDAIVDVFNLFNRANFTDVNNIFGIGAYPTNPSPTFGQFQQAGPPRQAQLAAEGQLLNAWMLQTRSRGTFGTLKDEVQGSPLAPRQHVRHCVPGMVSSSVPRSSPPCPTVTPASPMRSRSAMNRGVVRTLPNTGRTAIQARSAARSA